MINGEETGKRQQLTKAPGAAVDPNSWEAILHVGDAYVGYAYLGVVYVGCAYVGYAYVGYAYDSC